MHIAIIGGGPAGLRAAEVAAERGARVTVFDAMPSAGRKFLVAGRGGLNLTNLEPRERFTERYSGPANRWGPLIADFNPQSLRAWAAGLGVETFAASTGRVYPRELKAAPLLRRWIARLRELGVEFAMRHRCVGLAAGPPLRLEFRFGEELRTTPMDAVVFALGGGSWPETGSDGKWIETFQAMGIRVEPLAPANCGWELNWPPGVLAAAEGEPLKNIVARAGASEVRGELLITRYGLEGGAIYQLGPALRAMERPVITIDFKPAHTVPQLIAKLGPVRRNMVAEATRRWRLSRGAAAILSECQGPLPHASAQALAERVKCCSLSLISPRPLSEAISSSGGVCWSELDPGLMISRLPGVFLAGEMIDWEAPTGGYLLQGCFATGTRAGNAAVAWVASSRARAS